MILDVMYDIYIWYMVVMPWFWMGYHGIYHTSLVFSVDIRAWQVTSGIFHVIQQKANLSHALKNTAWTSLLQHRNVNNCSVKRSFGAAPSGSFVPKYPFSYNFLSLYSTLVEQRFSFPFRYFYFAFKASLHIENSRLSINERLVVLLFTQIMNNRTSTLSLFMLSPTRIGPHFSLLLPR